MRRASLAANWALNGKPEGALFLFAWKGAQAELGTARALAFFFRLLSRTQSSKIIKEQRLAELLEYVCSDAQPVAKSATTN